MKKFIGVICCVICFFSSCRTNTDILNEKQIFSIKNFESYSTIIDSKDDATILLYADSRNIRFWVSACRVAEKLDKDISNQWTYKLIFCDTDDIICMESIYYIPHTATCHIVYICEEEGIIQFDDTAYLIDKSNEGLISIVDGIRNYLDK